MPTYAKQYTHKEKEKEEKETNFLAHLKHLTLVHDLADLKNISLKII